MKRATWGVVLAWALAMAVSCEEDSDGPSADDAPQAVAATACRWHFECGCDENMNSRFTSQDQCELEIASEVQADIDRGQEEGLIYASQCIQTYLDGFNALRCATTIDVLDDPNLQRALADAAGCKLFYGMREAGQSCTDAEDNLGDTCRPELQCEDEVCVVVDPILTVGMPCESQDPNCEPGLLCIDVDGDETFTCESLPTGGQTCLGMADLCDDAFYCEQASKTCAPLPGPGEACAPFASISAERCNAEAVCNLTDTQCEPVPQAGEACVVKCAEGLVCDDQVCQVADPLACLYDG